MNPFLDDPDLYDFPRIADKRSPLLTDVSGATSPRHWDEKKGYGLSGATLVYTGDGLAKPVLRFFAWRPEHFVAWEPFRTIVAKPPSGAKPTAFSIEHPFLAELGIVSVVVEDETMWTQQDAGLYTKDVKLIQWRESKPALGKPTATQWMQAPAQSAADKAIDDLVKQVKALA